jgi:hypothetical protein
MLLQDFHGDEEPGETRERLFRELVSPAVARFPDFELSLSSEVPSEADLMIADLSNMNEANYFKLGAASGAGLPIVYIVQNTDNLTLPIALQESIDSSDRIVKYGLPYDSDFLFDPDDIQALVDAIREILSTTWVHAPNSGLSSLSPAAQRGRLVDRIEDSAEALRALRLNSIGQHIDEIVAVAAELRRVPDKETPGAIKSSALKVLELLGSMADELKSQKGARFAIAGIVALLVGGTGIAGVSALAIGLAFFQGEDAFKKALEVLIHSAPKGKSATTPKRYASGQHPR